MLVTGLEEIRRVKRKIFSNMCLLAFTTVLLSAMLVTGILYGKFYSSMKQSVKNEAVYIAAAINFSGQEYLNIQKNTNEMSRVTLISSDGTVLYDSAEDKNMMENHLHRPEVVSAFENGFGEDVRLSKTLGTQYFYYALRLENGNILRVSNAVNSVYASVFASIPYLVLIFAAIFVAAILLANLMTKRIVVPINELNLDDPLSNDVYDELSPLLTRLSRQQAMLKKQMDSLKEKQEEFSAITEHMDEGLIILDVNANILSINNSALKLLGVSSKNCVGQHILTVNRSLALQTAVNSALGGEACEDSLSVGRYHYQLLANPVFVNKTLTGAVLLIIDVTQKHMAEQMRREFSANVSHELKTPLTSISGYAEILKNGLVKPADIQRFSERIYAEASRLIALVEDIMKLSRLDESAPDLPFEEVNLLSLSQEICRRISLLAQKKHIEISVRGDSVSIRGVRQILDEMIYNLVSNAVMYNRDGGSVTVSVFKTSAKTVLEVADTGIGIAPEHQDRIFERFYRVDKSHSKETGGTGLGLSIVKHGANYHGAKIELESQPGKGTKVQIIFPQNIGEQYPI
ncbi:MAG: histidine kinase [Clostridium sp.]